MNWSKPSLCRHSPRYFRPWSVISPLLFTSQQRPIRNFAYAPTPNSIDLNELNLSRLLLKIFRLSSVNSMNPEWTSILRTFFIDLVILAKVLPKSFLQNQNSNHILCFYSKSWNPRNPKTIASTFFFICECKCFWTRSSWYLQDGDVNFFRNKILLLIASIFNFLSFYKGIDWNIVFFCLFFREF